MSTDSLRPCYDHLKGPTALRLTELLLERGWLIETAQAGPALTEAGQSALESLGVDLGPLVGTKRKVVAWCTERRGGQRAEHVGGHLGALIRHWVEAHPEALSACLDSSVLTQEAP